MDNLLRIFIDILNLGWYLKYNFCGLNIAWLHKIQISKGLKRLKLHLNLNI